jgi:hypothetical protein
MLYNHVIGGAYNMIIWPHNQKSGGMTIYIEKWYGHHDDFSLSY